ncbi:MAG TPA: glutamate--cysteine ligase [Burkholderiales bacterium]|nr:glutamate--cysteine ligase [Burkholderiales bacterium]
MSPLETRLQNLSPSLLANLRRGIEKESLRVRADGALAMTPHPPALGSALTHPLITTDFSEAQLELITGVHPSAEACLEELTRIHQFVHRSIDEEMLWCASMPCGLPADDEIPVGVYGRSNIGRAKTVYRVGLGYRYGRRMQTISGIHYNFSVPAQTWPALGVRGANEGYFALLRNFRRHGWLLFYLFGASPAVCASFVEGRTHRLQQLKPGTLYLPHATSLRMGRLGYQSDAQSSIAASFNSMEAYGASLEEALLKPYPPYEKIGLRDERGEYRQLATSLLQIENEFYGKIRPKRRIATGERPLHALRARGVEYVEVRLMDLDPFAPVGITAPVMRLLDVFLLHCLLADSPLDTPQELSEIARNQECVAARGREPGLQLLRRAEQIPLADWGQRILEECAPIAAALDAATGTSQHVEALASALEALRMPDATPSARVLAAMSGNYENSYTGFVVAQSHGHDATLRNASLPEDAAQRFSAMARESLEKQRSMEASDELPFEEWRKRYLSPEMIRA